MANVSKRFMFATGAVALAFGAWILFHKPAKHTRPVADAEETSEHQSSPVAKAFARGAGGSAKMAFQLPQNPVLLSDMGRKPKAVISQKSKVRLNLGVLTKSAAFRKANPKFNLSDYKAGRIPASAVIIPAGTGLSAELNAECKGRYQWIDNQKLTVREEDNLSKGLPVFLSYRQNADQNLQQISDSMDRNQCVFNVGLNDSMAIHQAGLTREEKIEFWQKAKQDRVLTEAIVKAAVSAGQTPRMAVVGSISDLKQADPALLANEDGKILATLTPYYVPSENAAVKVSRLAFPIRDTVSNSDAAVSNAIIRAAMSGANIINVVRPTYDSANFQSAVAIAEKVGAVVVSHVPVRMPASQGR